MRVSVFLVALFWLCGAEELINGTLPMPSEHVVQVPPSWNIFFRASPEEQQNALFSTKDAPFWLVIHREWVPNYASRTRYLMWCGDGTDDCNVPRHWRHSTAFFDTREAALAWVNEKFHKEPDRFVALRRCELPEAVESTTEVKRTEIVQEEKITKWK